MRTKLGNPRETIAPIGFALLAVVLSIVAWISFGGSVPLQPEGYRFSVVVPQASNLQAGAVVRSAGVDVGHVVALERAGHKARITLELDSHYAPLSSDARLTIRSKSLLGEAYVQVVFGDRSAAPVPDGGRLAAANVVPPQRLDDVLATFDAPTREGMRRLVSGISDAVDERGGDISGASAYAAPAARSMADLAELAGRQTDDIRALVSNGGQVLTEVGGREGAVQALIGEGRSLLEVTADRREKLSDIVAALPPFLDEARGAGDAVTAAAPELSAALDALAPAAPLLVPALAGVEDLVPDANGLLADLPRPLRAAGRGLPALQRILAVLRPALADAYPALREIVPITQFVATDPSFVTSTAANLASLGNAYVPGPGGTKVRYARAVPMLWNELVAGLKEPLPTSRQNQYPSPGSLYDIGKAPLKAWSCDHLGNPQTIPVIPPGTGAPPCVVQGPYEYRGKTAYFPRLLRAKP